MDAWLILRILSLWLGGVAVAVLINSIALNQKFSLGIFNLKAIACSLIGALACLFAGPMLFLFLMFVFLDPYEPQLFNPFPVAGLISHVSASIGSFFVFLYFIPNKKAQE